MTRRKVEAPFLADRVSTCHRTHFKLQLKIRAPDCRSLDCHAMCYESGDAVPEIVNRNMTVHLKLTPDKNLYVDEPHTSANQSKRAALKKIQARWLHIVLMCFLVLNMKFANALVRLEQFNDTGKYTIIIKGEIAEVDEEDLKVAIDTVQKNNYQLHLNMVQLNSRGGNKGAGIEIGRLIRKHKLNTFVPPDGRCNSACVFAFIGGVQRYGFGRIGVHSTTFSEGFEILEKYVPYVVDKDIETVTNYIKEQRISTQLASAILGTPFWTVRFLTDDEKRNWNVSGTDRVEAEILVTRIAKERSMKRSDFSELVGKKWDECFEKAKLFEQTSWDCLRTVVNSESWNDLLKRSIRKLLLV